MQFDLRWLRDALRAVRETLAGPPERWAPGERRDGVERRSLDGISYLAAGDPTGRRVVLVHGSPSVAEEWAGLLRGVPPGLEFVAVDRPGFGHSGPAAVPVELAEQAAAIAPLLHGRNGKRALLVGHSMGAPVAMRTVLDHPERVGGLLLSGAALAAELERVHPMQRVAALPWVAALLPRALRNSNAELIALKGQLALMEPRLGDVAVPVTAVHGTDDPLVPFANVAFLRAALSGPGVRRFIDVPGADHFLPWSHEELIRSSIADLAATADAAGV
jgi:pimeloyl-ACP methyl ester carboxylesterase